MEKQRAITLSGKHVAVLFAFTHLRLPAYQRSNAVTTYWCHPCIIIDPSGLLGTGNRWGGGWAKKGREGESKRSEIWQVRERQHDELLYWIYTGAVCAK